MATTYGSPAVRIEAVPTTAGHLARRWLALATIVGASVFTVACLYIGIA